MEKLSNSLPINKHLDGISCWNQKNILKASTTFSGLSKNTKGIFLVGWIEYFPIKWNPMWKLFTSPLVAYDLLLLSISAWFVLDFLSETVLLQIEASICLIIPKQEVLVYPICNQITKHRILTFTSHKLKLSLHTHA